MRVFATIPGPGFRRMAAAGIAAIAALAIGTAYSKSPRPVLLVVGDSMSGCYAGSLRERVKDRYAVKLIPENGRSTRHGLTRIDHWLKTFKPNVVLFNWGLHDARLKARPDRIFRPAIGDAEYLRNIEALYAKIRAGGARAIWLTTTPVTPQPGIYDPALIERRNAVVGGLMATKRVEVIDTYNVLRAAYDVLAHDDGIHFTRAGCAFYGQLVALHLDRLDRLSLGRRSPDRRSPDRRRK